MLKTPAQLAEEAKAEVPEISADQVKQDVAKSPLPYTLIDVREPEEVAGGKIPGAMAVPRGTLEINLPRAISDENMAIVCYCGGGTRSLLAGQQLKKMGYRNVKSMAGGMRAWKMVGGELE